MTVLSIDGIGAMSKLMDVPGLQKLLPFVRKTYAQPSRCIWEAWGETLDLAARRWGAGGPSHATVQGTLVRVFRRCVRQSPRGVKILGTPVGTDEFVQAKIVSRLEDERSLWEAVSWVPDLQCAWQIILQCASPCSAQCHQVRWHSTPKAMTKA